MSQVRRLSGTQLRRWRINQPKIVFEDTGEVARDATKHEVRRDFDARRRHKRLLITIDDRRCKIVGDRELMKKELFDLFGECQVRRPNGTFLVAIRDPNLKRPSAKQSSKIAPSPENCTCRDWGEPHPGKHHKICQWNNLAPANERGDIEVNPRAFRQTTRENRPSVIREETSMPIELNSNEPDIPEPDECFCAAWVKVEGQVEGQHHPLCEFYDKHLSKLLGNTQSIIDLESGEAIRPATVDEVNEAKQNMQAKGSSTIKLGNKLYGVGETKKLEKSEPSDSEELMEEDSDVAAFEAKKLYLFQDGERLRALKLDELELVKWDDDEKIKGKIPIGKITYLVAPYDYQDPAVQQEFEEDDPDAPPPEVRGPPPSPTFYLFDTEGCPMRRARPDEVRKTRADVKRPGEAVIKIGSRDYIIALAGYKPHPPPSSEGSSDQTTSP
jgi:hypothetical protein